MIIFICSIWNWFPLQVRSVKFSKFDCTVFNPPSRNFQGRAKAGTWSGVSRGNSSGRDHYDICRREICLGQAWVWTTFLSFYFRLFALPSFSAHRFVHQTILDFFFIFAKKQGIRSEFLPESYNILKHNCNHFVKELCKVVLGEDKVPKWINKLARFAL